MVIHKKAKSTDRDTLIEEAIDLIQIASDEIIIAALKAALETK